MRQSENRAGNVSEAENERYIASMHRLGSRGMIGAILIMLGMPTVLGLYFGSLPGLGRVLQAAVPLMVIFLPSNLLEVISYTPILGSSVYLALLTGEVFNLKLPVVSSVLKAMETEPGTVEADVIASIAVATASLLAMAVVALGIALAIPLQPVLALPSVRIASGNLFPAVLGALLVSILLTEDLGGGVYARGRLKGLILPVILVALISYFDPQLSALLRLDTLLGQEGAGVLMSVLQGFVAIAVWPFVWLGTNWLYKRNKIRISLYGETPEC